MPLLSVALRGLPAVFLGASALSAAASSPPDAWMRECEASLPATRIEVRTEAVPVSYAFNLNIEALNKRRSLSKGNMLTLGLTENLVQTSIRSRSSSLTRPTEPLTCMRPDISVTLSLSPHTVFVAQEFAQGTCAFHHIAEHELKHVMVNNMALTRTANQLRLQLHASFGNRVFYGTQQALQDQFNQHLQHWLTWAKAEMGKTLRLHEEIDSPQEYARNRTACNGEIARIIDRLP